MEGLSYGGESFLNFHPELEIDEEDYNFNEYEGEDGFFRELAEGIGDKWKTMQSNVANRRSKKLDLKSKQLDVDAQRIKAEMEKAKAESKSIGELAKSMDGSNNKNDNTKYWIIGGVVLFAIIGIGVFLYIKSKKG